MPQGSPPPRALAKQLLAYEAVAGEPSEGNMSAAFRVAERLRRLLSPLVGIAGFHALFSRALILAKAEVPGSAFHALQINADGSLASLDITGQYPPEDDDGGVILIAQLVGLLFTFIGEALTRRLVHEVWPVALFSSRDTDKESHDSTKQSDYQ